MRNGIILGVVAAFVVVAAPAFAQVQPTGQWATLGTAGGSYAPGAHQWGAGCTDGTYLYYWGSNISNQGHWRYDFLINGWTALPIIPVAFRVYVGTGCNYGGTGGANYSFGDNTVLNGSVRKYNLTTQTWSMPSGTHPGSIRPGVAVSGSFIYVFGGNSSNATSRFDPATDTFSTMTVMPQGMDGCSAATSPITGKIYVTFQTSIWEYTPGGGFVLIPATGTPATRQYHGSFAANTGRIYVVGGNTSTLQVDEFFPDGTGGGTWTRRADCPTLHYYGVGTGVMAAKNKAFAIFGNTAATHEYTPPSFGVAPNPAANVIQVGNQGLTPQAGADPDEGWTDHGMIFHADVTDSDSPTMRFEVQVKEENQAWAQAVTITSALAGPGTHHATFAATNTGNYDWRYHTVDNFGNFTPNTGGVPGWTEFEGNTVTPDFRCDLTAPAAPVGVSPDTYDVNVPSIVAGDVNFQWAVAADNGPASAIRYQIDISFNDDLFGNIVRTASDLVPTTHMFNLPVSKYFYYYRVRAKDIGGNWGAFGATKYFRVVGNDGYNHGSGDALSTCGFSVPAGSSAALLALAAAMVAAFRRRS